MVFFTYLSSDCIVCLSTASQPKKGYAIIPQTDTKTMNKFQKAMYFALGLYFCTTNPETKTPKAENTSPTVPVTRLAVLADTLY